MQIDAERLDEVPFEELTVADGRAHAVVRRAHAEWLSEGHFPGDPIVPGAYLAGLMADVAAALIARSSIRWPSPREAGDSVRLSAIEDCVFVRRVAPHEQIAIDARLAPTTADQMRVNAEVWTGGVCAVRATFRFGGDS